jgi:hypothetical protein
MRLERSKRTYSRNLMLRDIRASRLCNDKGIPIRGNVIPKFPSTSSESVADKDRMILRMVKDPAIALFNP